MKKFLVLTMVFVLSFGCCAAAQATTYLGMGTGGETGTYYALGADIASLWMNNIADLDVTVQTSGGSKDNIVTMAEGDFELATVQNDVAAYAYAGSEFFGGEVYDGFYAICSMYPEAVQIVVAADSDIHSVSDLKGKNVSVGAIGSGVYFNAVQILEAAGMTLDDINPQYLSFSESASSFQDGQIDAAFMVSGVPNTSVVEITTKQDVRLLTLTDDEFAYLQENYSYYSPYTVPAGTYSGMDEDAVVPAVSAILIVSKDMDDDLVYQLTKVLFEQTDSLTHAKKAEITTATALDGVSVDLAPGALRYFEEIGIK